MTEDEFNQYLSLLASEDGELFELGVTILSSKYDIEFVVSPEDLHNSPYFIELYAGHKLSELIRTERGWFHFLNIHKNLREAGFITLLQILKERVNND